MALAQYSGKDAYINGIGCLQNWTASVAVTSQKFSASCVPAATDVPPGIQDWKGTASGLGSLPPAVILMPSADLAFQGVVNNTAGLGDILSLNGNIAVEQLTIDMNKETNAVIGWQLGFCFQGVPTEATSSAVDAAYADNSGSAGSLLYPNNLSILVAGVAIESTSNRLRTVQIVFKRQVVNYIVGGVTLRKYGNLEADVSFSMFSPTLKLAALAPNNLADLQVTVDASGYNYWLFSKVRMLGKSNYVVDRQTNAIVGYTQACSWNAATAGAQGNISYGNTADDIHSGGAVYGVNPNTV